MQRRKFIKNSILLGCAGSLLSGCNFLFKDKSGKYKNNFIYKAKVQLPKKIFLEACSLCQLHCPECPVGNIPGEKTNKKLGYLKFKDFRNFVDDNNFERIELSNHGEIFLNPELDEIIEYGFKKKISLGAKGGVNLNTVNKKTLENLVKYKFSNLYISIDGATPKTYSIYRQGGDFNTVIENIKKINYFKKKYNSQFPILTWQFIPFGHNEHEIELAKKKALELNMDITFKQNFSPGYSPLKNKNMVEKQIEKKKSRKPCTACYMMFQSPCIDFDGTLLGCCNVVHPNDFKVNVFEIGLLNALNSKMFIESKNMLSDFSIEPKAQNPCTNCPGYKYNKKYNLPVV